MTDTRETMIKVLTEVLPYSHGCPEYIARAKAEMIAVQLIANGVTIQRWIPVTERLPEEDVRVLVWLTAFDNSYTKMDTDRIHHKQWVRWGKYITHWMLLPEPPKGE